MQQARDPRIESLHQQASANYLQGNFEASFKAWKELLSIDPDDERAMEGVRLCEMLAAEGQFDIEAAVTAVEQATPPPPPAAAKPAAPPAGSVDGGDFDFDFSELDEDAAIDLPDPARQNDGIEADLDVPSLPLAAGRPPADHGADPAGDAAAIELRNRVEQLYAEAESAFGEGDLDTAQSLLNRLLILDEEHAGAIALSERLQASIGGGEPARGESARHEPVLHEHTGPREFDFEAEGSPLGEASDASAASPLASVPTDLDLDLQDTLTPPPSAAAAPPELPEPPPLPDAVAIDAEGSYADARRDPVDDGNAYEPLDSTFHPAVAVVSAERSSRLGGLNPKLLVIVVGVVLLVAGGYVASTMLGRSSSSGDGGAAVTADGSGGTEGEDAAATPARGKKHKTHNGAAAQAGIADAVADPAPAAAPPPRLDEATVAALLDEGQTAMDDGDYAAAVVAYGKVFQSNPDNLEARDRLAEASDRYRALRAQLDKREEAIADFNRGDFRSALTLFYRLPEGPARENVTRYMRNGWYNLGVQALQASDCRQARDHFTEARNLDPDDAGVAQGLELASTCRSASRDRSYYSGIEVLSLRGLDD